MMNRLGLIRRLSLYNKLSCKKMITLFEEIVSMIKMTYRVSELGEVNAIPTVPPELDGDDAFFSKRGIFLLLFFSLYRLCDSWVSYCYL